MPTQVIMPQFGESVIEGTITRWLKSPGEEVSEFEPLLEVNTDKVDSEIPSPVAGVLLDVVVPEGATVQAGTTLAWIGEPGETTPEGGGNGDKARSEGGALSQSTLSPPVGVVEETAPRAMPVPGRDRDLGFISPVVARIASEKGIDLFQVTGTGQSGRITKKDILNYLEQREKSPPPSIAAPDWQPPAGVDVIRKTERPSQPAAQQPPSAPTDGQVLPLDPVRRAIAEHMVFSKHTSPHVTTVMEADLSRVVAHRNAHKAVYSQDGVNLTFTAYFIAASAAALKAYPKVNSSWREEGILLHRPIHIGMATSLGEEGLIVPIIKNADGLSLLGLARTVNDLSNRARLRKLQPDEVKGGTFTITNHGTSGSLFATPIINQPQCAILGLGVVQKRVVVIEDAIGIRPMVYLSLTFDHRILDGVIADSFLGKVVEYLESWGQGN